MSAKIAKTKKEDSKLKGITFKCKFCEKPKLFDEMVVLTRFFPPVVLCRDCEGKDARGEV